MTPQATSKRDKPPQDRGSGLRISVTGSDKALHEDIRRTAAAALRAEGFPRGTLEIQIAGSALMRRLHAQWLNEDSVTDVLTFDLRESSRPGHVDGQLVVCSAVARRRAASRGSDWTAELLLYVVHGCLHLCGYDDDAAATAARMHAREDAILSRLGWGPVFSRRFMSRPQPAAASDREPRRRTAR